jgi:alpha-1,6-mannosyltransferase
MKQLIWLALAGGSQEFVWISINSLGPLRDHTVSFLSLILIAFTLCIWAWLRFPGRNRHAVWLLLGFALLFRITAVLGVPYQSEDVYRYIWDARISSIGINPYRYAPDAPELRVFRDNKSYSMINSKAYITAYPPLSQILFRLSFGIFGPSFVAMKALFSLFEFLAVLLAWRLLVLWNQDIRSLVLMAWNPFFIFEFSHSGHSDSSMIFLALLSIYLLSRGKKTLSSLAYAGAVLAKLHPALWFPLFLRQNGRKAAVAGIAAGAAMTIIYFNPYSLIHYLKSLSLYFRLFEFNASIHYLIRFMGRTAFQESWDKLIGPYLGLLLGIVTILIVWKFPVQNARDLLHAGFWIMVADLCLATTVHPWYLSWAALAIPAFPYAFMVYWTGACYLSYIAYSYHPVFEPGWALILEYLPMYALMSWEIWRRRPLLGAVPERRTM